MARENPSLYPLRKIVGPGPKGRGDLLECGHDLPEGSDIYGPRPASVARRCRYCWNALSQEEKDARKKAAAERKEARQRADFERWRGYRGLG